MVIRLVKSFNHIKKVNKISRILGENCRPGSHTSLHDLMDSKSEMLKKEAMQEMHNLWESSHLLSPIIKKHGETSENLEKLYHLLMLNGAGQWIQGYFLPVTVLCLPVPLEYVLKNKDHTSMLDLCAKLVDYLDEGNPFLPIS